MSKHSIGMDVSKLVDQSQLTSPSQLNYHNNYVGSSSASEFTFGGMGITSTPSYCLDGGTVIFLGDKIYNLVDILNILLDAYLPVDVEENKVKMVKVRELLGDKESK